MSTTYEQSAHIHETVTSDEVIMAARKDSDGDTASAILDAAERLVQTRGFNAFSYADVAAELGVTKPALHYHFAGKAELGEALIARYTTRFSEALETIDSGKENAVQKLDAYADLYAQVLAQNRMCLCGMLAADYHTLPEPMRQAVIAFFDDNENWLASVLDQGRHDGTLELDGSSREVAQMIIGSLEGAMLVARTYRDPHRFASSARRVLSDITTPTGRSTPGGGARRRGRVGPDGPVGVSG
jgi:TetR/AcrR family transcriptional repressor of nem operon